MTSETLKKRAKNLRRAVEGMLQVSVTHSQSLELVAKEENFPNWDAACASLKTSNTGLRVAHEVSDVAIRQMLAPSNSFGALIVVWGVTGQGKTPTARAIIEHGIAQASADKPSTVLHVGFMEKTYPAYPKMLAVRYVDEKESIIGSGQLKETLVVVDDLRDPHITFEVVAMVLAGAKVVVTVHANDPVDRLRALLKMQGMGALLLERLLGNGQVLAITARR